MDAGVELADGADRVGEVRGLFAEGAEDLDEDVVGLRRLLAAVLLLIETLGSSTLAMKKTFFCTVVMKV